MSILEKLKISEVSFKLVDSIEQSIQARLGTTQPFVTTSDYKEATRIITEIVLTALDLTDKCPRCHKDIETYPHSCKGFTSVSRYTSHWIDDQAS